MPNIRNIPKGLHTKILSTERLRGSLKAFGSLFVTVRSLADNTCTILTGNSNQKEELHTAAGGPGASFINHNGRSFTKLLITFLTLKRWYHPHLLDWDLPGGYSQMTLRHIWQTSRTIVQSDLALGNPRKILSSILWIVVNCPSLGLFPKRRHCRPRWGQRINNACSKANRKLDFLKRNIGSMSTKEQAYNTFIRVSLCYIIWVWDPYTKRNINKIEAVQLRAAVGSSLWTVATHSASAPCWWGWRKIARLAVFFKISNGLVNVSSSHLIVPARRSNYQHTNAFYVPFSEQTIGHIPSFLKIIPDWSGLPEIFQSSQQ